jgi:hypothetical protein
LIFATQTQSGQIFYDGFINLRAAQPINRDHEVSGAVVDLTAWICFSRQITDSSSTNAVSFLSACNTEFQTGLLCPSG